MTKYKRHSSHRFLWIDHLRGIAIILMVIFHGCYDLRYFGWVDWDVPNGAGWWQFRYLILTLFIFTMGLSLSIAHHKHISRNRFAIRLLQLGIAATLVTLISLTMFPNSWIYFGILHFLLVASVISIFFIKHALLAFLIGLLILNTYWLGLTPASFPFSFIGNILPNDTEDFVPLFPWLGVCLIGLAAGQWLPLQKIERYSPRLPNIVSFLGRHSLIIYLIHQPILFAVLIAITLFIA